MVFFVLCPVRADTVWESGHHEIFEDDIYNEIWMYDDATADMFGGDVFKLEAFDTTAFDMLGGEMDLLYIHDSSNINIHGGILGALGATGNSLVDLYAYDVIYHSMGGHFDRGWVEGKYLVNDLFFTFDLNHVDTFSHVNIVPEPATLLLMSFGTLILTRRIC